MTVTALNAIPLAMSAVAAYGVLTRAHAVIGMVLFCFALVVQGISGILVRALAGDRPWRYALRFFSLAQRSDSCMALIAVCLLRGCAGENEHFSIRGSDMAPAAS